MTANLVWLCFLGTHSQTAPMEAPPQFCTAVSPVKNACYLFTHMHNRGDM